MQQPYTIIARMRAKPGERENLRQLLEAQVKPTRDESGCLGYHLHQGDVDPDVFIVYENWRSERDVEKHQAMPHLKPLGERGPDLLEGGLEVITLNMLSRFDDRDGQA